MANSYSLIVCPRPIYIASPNMTMLSVWDRVRERHRDRKTMTERWRERWD